MSDKARFSYLAGIIDGEGCLTIGAGRKQYCVNYNSIINVANTDIRLIKWLHENFGGKYYSIKKPTPRNKTPYVWRLLKQKEQERLLLAILPYLIIKRERAIILLEFVRLPRTADSSKRKELFDKLTALNKRGIGVTTNTSSLPENEDYSTFRSKSCMPGCNCSEGDHGEVKIESGLTGDCESAPAVTLAEEEPYEDDYNFGSCLLP